MKSMLEWYGQDGMHSESEVEDIEEIYCPKFLPWRRKSASEMMDLIDKVRRLPGQRSHSKKGRLPTKRCCGEGNATSTWPACQGLPIELYDSHWFDGLMRSERSKLKVSSEPFEFIHSFIGATKDLEGEAMDKRNKGSDENESDDG